MSPQHDRLVHLVVNRVTSVRWRAVGSETQHQKVLLLAILRCTADASSTSSLLHNAANETYRSGTLDAVAPTSPALADTGERLRLWEVTFCQSDVPLHDPKQRLSAQREGGALFCSLDVSVFDVDQMVKGDGTSPSSSPTYVLRRAHIGTGSIFLNPLEANATHRATLAIGVQGCEVDVDVTMQQCGTIVHPPDPIPLDRAIADSVSTAPCMALGPFSSVWRSALSAAVATVCAAKAPPQHAADMLITRQRQFVEGSSHRTVVVTVFPPWRFTVDDVCDVARHVAHVAGTHAASGVDPASFDEFLREQCLAATVATARELRRQGERWRTLGPEKISPTERPFDWLRRCQESFMLGGAVVSPALQEQESTVPPRPPATLAAASSVESLRYSLNDVLEVMATFGLRWRSTCLKHQCFLEGTSPGQVARQASGALWGAASDDDAMLHRSLVVLHGGPSGLLREAAIPAPLAYGGFLPVDSSIVHPFTTRPVASRDRYRVPQPAPDLSREFLEKEEQQQQGDNAHIAVLNSPIASADERDGSSSDTDTSFAHYVASHMSSSTEVVSMTPLRRGLVEEYETALTRSGAHECLTPPSPRVETLLCVTISHAKLRGYDIRSCHIIDCWLEACVLADGCVVEGGVVESCFVGGACTITRAARCRSSMLVRTTIGGCYPTNCRLVNCVVSNCPPPSSDAAAAAAAGRRPPSGITQCSFSNDCYVQPGCSVAYSTATSTALHGVIDDGANVFHSGVIFGPPPRAVL